MELNNIIYAMKDYSSEKVYIGSVTATFYSIFSVFSDLSSNSHENKELQKDYKNGADLKYEVLEEKVPNKDLENRENYWKYMYRLEGWYLYSKPVDNSKMSNDEWIEKVLTEAKERGVLLKCDGYMEDYNMKHQILHPDGTMEEAK